MVFCNFCWSFMTLRGSTFIILRGVWGQPPPLQIEKTKIGPKNVQKWHFYKKLQNLIGWRYWGETLRSYTLRQKPTFHFSELFHRCTRGRQGAKSHFLLKVQFPRDIPFLFWWTTSEGTNEILLATKYQKSHVDISSGAELWPFCSNLLWPICFFCLW